MAERVTAPDRPTIAVSGLSKSYAGVKALVDVSLEIRPGEVVGLLGANGAGKTTLLDLIGGEQSADSGTVQLNGKVVTGPPHQRARAGLGRTFQHPKVSADLTVLENVAIGLAVKELAGWAVVRSLASAVLLGRDSYADRAAAMCAMVGLDNLDRTASELSFGELRLLEVARALAQEPSGLLLDEPFPGLEDDGVAQLSAAIRHVADSGRAVVLVDHNLTLVQAVVDRVLLLARGRMAFSGTAAECLASPQFQYEYVGGATP